MTREEMIEQLENTILLIKQNGKDWLDERDILLLKIVIQILKQQTCKDTISRENVLKAIETVCFSDAWKEFRINNGSNGTRDYIINYIKQMPSVQPELNCKSCVLRMGYGTGIDEGILNALPKVPADREDLGVCKYAPRGYGIDKCPFQEKGCKKQCVQVQGVLADKERSDKERQEKR